MSNIENQFAGIVRETKSTVLSAISRTLKPEYAHMIDDVVQETYIRAFNSLKKNQFRYEASLNTWLYTIARNESLRFNSKLNKQSNIEQDLDERILLNTTTEDGQYFKKSASASITGKLDILYSIINQLPMKYKSVLELDILGFKDWQIAEKLKISLGTVKSRNFRAREKVRQWVHQIKLT